MVWRISLSRGKVLTLLGILLSQLLLAQSETSGTVMGTLVDPSGAVVQNVAVDLRNPATGYSQTAVTDAAGVFRFHNVPRSTYRLQVTAQGFKALEQSVEVNIAVPVVVTLRVEVLAERTTVEVAASAALIDPAPGAHTDVCT